MRLPRKFLGHPAAKHLRQLRRFAASPEGVRLIEDMPEYTRACDELGSRPWRCLWDAAAEEELGYWKETVEFFMAAVGDTPDAPLDRASDAALALACFPDALAFVEHSYEQLMVLYRMTKHPMYLCMAPYAKAMERTHA